MKIYFASYQEVLINRGGPTYKIFCLKQALEKIGVQVELFNMWNKNLNLTNKDFVHLFTANMNTYSLAKNFALKSVPYVVNPIFYSTHSGSIIKAYRKIEKMLSPILKRTYSDYFFTEEICRNAKMFLPNTKAEGELLCQAFDLEYSKSEVIYNGVEKRFAEADSSLFEKKYGLKDFVLYVGHLGSARKNGKRLVQSLQKLDVPSVIIADVLNTPEGKWCEEEIQKSSKITLIKWIQHDDPLLASAYAACDVFALPTLFETPGRAALEAGLAGAKIVITPHGGTKEYFQYNAIYSDPFSVKQMTEDLEKALNDSKSETIKNFIMNNFTWEKIAQQTKKLYQKFIDE